MFPKLLGYTTKMFLKYYLKEKAIPQHARLEPKLSNCRKLCEVTWVSLNMQWDVYIIFTLTISLFPDKFGVKVGP